MPHSLRRSSQVSSVPNTEDQHTEHKIKSSEDNKSKDLTSSSVQVDHAQHQLSSFLESERKVVEGATTNQPQFTSTEDVISKDTVVSDTKDQYWHHLPPSEDSGNNDAGASYEKGDDHLEVTSAGSSGSKNAAAVAVDSDADYQPVYHITAPKESNSKDIYDKDTERSEADNSHGGVFYIALHDYVRAFQNINFHKGTLTRQKYNAQLHNLSLLYVPETINFVCIYISFLNYHACKSLSLFNDSDSLIDI